MDSRRATDSSFEGAPEAGWMFAAAAHGGGMAAEAVTAMLGWADAQGMTRTACIIAPDNAASIRLAGRMGYKLLEQATYRDEVILLFERRV